jgi:hypothetical protein
MPYLDEDWEIDAEEVETGTWIPERNWDRWRERAMHVSESELIWRHREVIEEPPVELDDAALAVLAGDIASAQRDAFVYTNLIERLKNSPSDTVADEVVEEMMTLGFVSAGWPEYVGGPPEPESPRPFRRVLDWLLRLAAKVNKFLLNCVHFVMASLSGISAVAVGISWGPPSVSFEWPTKSFQDHAAWEKVRNFFDNVVAELEEKVFSA